MGSNGFVVGIKEVEEFGEKNGYLLMIKVFFGGGGCGMCVVELKEYVKESFECVFLEVKVVFGNDEVYVEKCVMNLKYIEV